MIQRFGAIVVEEDIAETVEEILHDKQLAVL
jgi:hypothetical protein